MSAPAAPASPHDLLHPRHWKAARGYANGVAARGRLVFCGGLVGWNADQQFETDDFAGQVDQTLRNIVAVLAEAGAGPQHLVRLTWYVTDKQDYLAALPQVGASYRAIIGRHYPAMALVQVVALVEDRARVEIEATAVVPED
jgi:enamine deaminase RidA (YjgF/YER057c/UK114 family)